MCIDVPMQLTVEIAAGAGVASANIAQLGHVLAPQYARLDRVDEVSVVARLLRDVANPAKGDKLCLLHMRQRVSGGEP